AGSTANTISNTTSDAGSAPKLLTLDATLADAYWANARWFMTGAIHGAISKLVDASGRWLFDPNETDENGERLLLGHPVSRSSVMASDGTAGARVLALVDLSQYLVASRSMLSLAVNRET